MRRGRMEHRSREKGGLHRVKTDMSWRSYDRPMPGTIFRLPDDMSLQRGITYTILPDGRNLLVPAMSRMSVRSKANSHGHDEHADIVQALTDMLEGKKPVKGRGRFNRHGQAHGGRIPQQPGNRPVRGGPPRRDPNEGVRNAGLAEE